MKKPSSFSFCIASIALSSQILFSASVYRGGSNYNWFNVNGCNYDVYYTISNYDIAQSTIDGQLQQMYNNGQRTIRIGIYFTRGGENCVGALGSRHTTLNSAGGNLSAQCVTNLTNFLRSVTNHGLSGQIGFFPQGANNPQNWPANWDSNSYYIGLYNEHFTLIRNLHSIIASNFNGKIDLLNEGIPPGNIPQWQGWLKYVQDLWIGYVNVFGRNDTVGFSFGGGSTGPINMLSYVYGGIDPPVFEIHFYPGLGQASSQYATTWNALHAQGRGQGWVIGEGFYDDSDEASGLASAQASYGNTVFFLTQWPWHRNSSCGGIDVVPLDFSNYTAAGW